MDEVICGLFICEFTCMWLKSILFYRTYPLIKSNPWSFYMQIHCMQDIFFAPITRIKRDLPVLLKNCSFEHFHIQVKRSWKILIISQAAKFIFRVWFKHTVTFFKAITKASSNRHYYLLWKRATAYWKRTLKTHLVTRQKTHSIVHLLSFQSSIAPSNW